jgi:hypothetical protein
MRKWLKAHIWSLTFYTLLALIFFFGVTILLNGCAQPTKLMKTHKTYVVNSLWQVVKTVETVDRAAPDVGNLQNDVDEYNAVTLDDFLRIYYDTLPDLDSAPPVSVFICNPVTYAVNWSMENVPRRSLVENEAGWRQDAAGQILFIDHVPPPPVIAPPPSLYAWYAIYEVDNNTGVILLEDHCGYWADETFHGQWITMPEGTFDEDGTPGGGWSSVDAYYQTILHAYQGDAIPLANHCHVVTRQLYTPPVAP